MGKEPNRLAEFEALLKIDKNDLDTEVERQATLYYSVGSEAARLRSVVDTAKDALDRVTASLDVEIREEALREGDKVTEGSIRSRVALDSTYQAATTKYLTAKGQLDQATALQEAFRQRTYMLRDLVELYVSGYFTDASVKGSVKQVREDHAVKNQEKMSERRRERLKDNA